MGAVLRAYGMNFDVEAFLAGCSLPVCAVHRRGEPRFPRSQPDGSRNDQSGVHVAVSEAEFDEFPRQVEEAADFLRVELAQIRRLCEFPGVEGITLDFGV